MKTGDALEGFSVVLTPRKTSLLLGFIISCLTFTHLGVVFLTAYLERELPLKLFALFDFDSENNLPTLFSVAILMISSALLWLIAVATKRRDRRGYWHWAWLSIVFFFAGLDEAVLVHERINQVVVGLSQTTRYPNVAWVAPYGIAAIIFSLAYVKFLFRLPMKTRFLIILAAMLFIGGAVGLEVIAEPYHILHHHERNVIYVLIYTVEELLEMTGVAVFIYALLSYIESELGGLDIRLGVRPEIRAAL